MIQTKAIDRDQQERIVDAAVRDRRPLTVTVSLPEGWRRFKGVFVSGSQRADETVISIGLPKSRPTAVLLEPGSMIGGAFRQGHKKCLFNASVRGCRTQGESVLLTLTWPEHFSQLQRRAFERAEPPRGAVVAVRFWRDGESGAGSVDRDVRHGQLEDISAGGLRIRVADSQTLEIERTYKCVFTPRAGKPAFVLEALLRHREAVEGSRASLGFQFVGLEASSDGLKTLDRIARLVSDYQRTRSKRV